MLLDFCSHITRTNWYNSFSYKIELIHNGARSFWKNMYYLPKMADNVLFIVCLPFRGV